MTEQTLLYALSTLAQTCAALAAFVGALGLYRLQSLDRERQETLHKLQAHLRGVRISPRDLPFTLTRDIVEIAKTVVASPHDQERERVPQIEEALKEWESFEPDHRRCKRLLFIFGGWNLLVILGALVGFDYLCFLSKWAWTSWALWAVAGGTVFVTGWMLLELRRGK